MTIQYNASDLGTLKCIFTRYKGTMLRMLVNSPAFWTLNCAHGACLIADRYSESYKLPAMDWLAIQMLSPLVAFFLIFYTSKAYGRLTSFFEQVLQPRAPSPCVTSPLWLAALAKARTRLPIPYDLRRPRPLLCSQS